MKKNYLLLTAIALFGIVSLSTCKKEKSVLDCTRLVTEVADAQSDYSANPTTENCNALKSKINSLIDNCPLYAETYETVYNELDCTD